MYDRAFQKHNFLSDQSAKLTNCSPVPPKHSPQRTINKIRQFLDPLYWKVCGPAQKYFK